MKRSAPGYEDIEETMKLKGKGSIVAAGGARPTAVAAPRRSRPRPAATSSQTLNVDGGDWMS
jgi:hypothetical protein